MIRTVTYDDTTHVLVRRKLTPEMMDAGRPRPPQWDKTEFSRKFRNECDQMRQNDWDAMLAAAPPVEAVTVTREKVRAFVADLFGPVVGHPEALDRLKERRERALDMWADKFMALLTPAPAKGESNE